MHMLARGRGPDESVLSLHLGYGGAGPVAAGPRGVLFATISLPVPVYWNLEGKGFSAMIHTPRHRPGRATAPGTHAPQGLWRAAIE